MPSLFANKLARIAQEQHDRFHRVNENDEPLRTQIEKFWTGIGLQFPGVETGWREFGRVQVQSGTLTVRSRSDS